jgi:hypothetical protein
VLAADQRVQLVLHRRLGEIAAELGQQRRLFHASQRRLFIQQLDDVLAHGVEPHPLFHEDGGRHRPLFTKNPEEQVLGADVVVEQAVGLFGRKLQNPLGFRAEREFSTEVDTFSRKTVRPSMSFPNVFEREVRRGKDPAGEPFPLANQAQEEVLGLNRDAAELTGLVASKKRTRLALSVYRSNIRPT